MRKRELVELATAFLAGPKQLHNWKQSHVYLMLL